MNRALLVVDMQNVIATSGVVLSTLRQAADLDYGLTVLADGCLDSDPGGAPGPAG
jgi:nicotinamidase-related amidase